MACSLDRAQDSQQCVLRQRQLSLDPYYRLQTLKKRLYSQKSYVKRFKIEKRLEAHNGCVNCINFSHSGHLLASGSDDLHIVLWDWANGTPVANFHSKHIANVFQAKFMPQTNDSVIVSAARDGQVRCHVISTTGELVTSKRVTHHNDSAHKLAIEPDNSHVFLSCGEDSNVLQIDLREDNSQRNKLLSVRNHTNTRVALYSIFIDPSNYNRFAISGRDPYARIYDRRMLSESRLSENPTYPDPVELYCPKHLITQQGHGKAHMTCLAYSYNGQELLCSYNDEDIYTFDTTATGSKEDYTRHFEGHRNSATVKGVNYYGLNSEYIVSGSDCGHVFLWDKETSEIVQYLTGDQEGVVNCLEPHPHIPILAISGLDHDVKIITPSSDRETDLKGLSEVIDNNVKRRKEDSEYSIDGYDMILSFIMREYRRGLRHQAGIESDEDSNHDDSNHDDSNHDDSNHDDNESYSNESSDEDNEEENEERRPLQPPIVRRRHNRRDNNDSNDEEDYENIQCVQS